VSRRVFTTGALLVALAWAPAASAQETPRFVTFGEADGLLTGFQYQVGIEKLADDDIRFRWDADFGADIDVLRIDDWRVNVSALYEIVLAQELQRFDPYFNNYTFDVLGGRQVGQLEVAGVFRHVSKHLGDRPKRFLIAWNEVGVQVTRRWQTGAHDLQARVRGLGVFIKHDVDYQGEIGGDLLWRRRVSPRVAIEGHGGVRVVPVDEGFQRGTQWAGRGEVGVRLAGRGAAVVFYGALDRRLDPDPMFPSAETWVLAGFRVTSP
jgi:hypothetical protein